MALHPIRFGEFRLGTELHRDGKLAVIARKPFAMLSYLATHRDRVVPRAELLEQIWPGVSIGNAAFSSALKDLRRALDDDGLRQRVIRTVRGRGLRFVASAQTESAGPASRERPFVGRSRELRRMVGWAEAAARGQPQVVVVVGDEGSGKTRLLEELIRHPSCSQFNVAFGYCEQGSSIPYLPFTKALSALRGEARGESERATQNAFANLSGALAPQVEPVHRRPMSRPEAGARERADLFHSIWRSLALAAKRRPTMMVIEDLQHADAASIDLFSSLCADVSDARSSNDTPLLLVATMHPQPPASRLGTVVRGILAQTSTNSIALSGLGVRATADLIAALGIARRSISLPRALHDVTEGNPLLLLEWVREADRTELVVDAEPADPRAALARRIARLDRETVEVLRVAAFIGESFGVSVLAAALGRSAEELTEWLSSENLSGIVVQSLGSFRFERSLVRELLRDETAPERSREIHARLAAVVDDLYAGDSSEHAIEIARHLIGGGELTDPDLLIFYASRAGDQASSACAWHDALHFYEAALSAHSRLPFAERADLHLRAGLVASHAADAEKALEHYEGACSAYRAAGDAVGEAWAATYAARTRFTISPGGFRLVYDLQFLESLLRKLGESEPALRALLLDTIATGNWAEGRPELALETAQEALALGRRIDDDVVCHHACMTLAVIHFSSLRLHASLASWLDADAYARRARDPWLETAPSSRIAFALMCLGRFREARERIREAKALARRAHNRAQLAHAIAQEASLEFALGNFSAADEAASAALVPVERSHFPWGGAAALIARASVAAQRGEWGSADSALDSLLEPRQAFSEENGAARFLAGAFRTVIRSYRSRATVDRGGLAALVERVPPVERCGFVLSAVCALVEAACQIGAREPIRALRGRLELALERGFVHSGGWSFSLSRLLGRCALLEARLADAEVALDRAVDTARVDGVRTELARAHLDRGRLRARRRDRRAALVDASTAVELASTLGMRPFERQARRFVRQLG